MGNEKTDWMIYSDREMSVMSAQEEKVSFKELLKSLGMTQKEFSETFGIPMGTLRHWISGDRECPVYTKRMLAYMVELKRLEAKRVIRQNIFAAILTGGDIYRNHDNDFQDTFNEAYQYYDTELEEPYFDFDNQEALQ